MTVPPFRRPGNPAEWAWLALIPTTTPNLTTAERERIAFMREWSDDPRVKARCDQLLAT